MRKIVVGIISGVALIGFAGVASAQGMMGGYGYDEAATASQATASTSDAGEATGAALLQKLQANQLTCSQLTDTDFASIGDYYMGQMMGSYHYRMDQYMTDTLGAQGDEQMHIALGERLSGCNTAAAYPQGGSGFFPLMTGMMGGGYPPRLASGEAGGMMGGYGAPFGYGPAFGYGSWWNTLLSVAVWIFAIIGVVTVARTLFVRK